MKRTQICLIGVAAFFFLAMAFLTFAARDIHNAGLPHVTVKRLTRESFSAENAQGMVSYRQLAIAKTLYDKGGVFVVLSRPVNGESRDFVQKVQIEIGVESEEYYEIVDGLNGDELVVLGSDRGFEEGDEVLVVR